MKIERPEWWPENPYPEDIFPMTRQQCVEAIPDERLRSAIAGCLGRFAWDVADKMIWDRWLQYREDNKL